MNKTKFSSLSLCCRLCIGLAILVLEVCCKFIYPRYAISPTTIIYGKETYLSLINLGYGDFFPILVFILTCTLILLTILELVKHLNLSKKVLFLAILTAIFNILPVCIGFSGMNIGIIAISVLLLLIGLLSFLKYKTSKGQL